jgi:hypothetical protein
MTSIRMSWNDQVDEILAGDHVVALVYATPAKGAVLLPVTNFGTRDRAAATISVNSSVGVPRKLERIRANPQVALAFHTRRHSLCDRPEYVLVQGRAELGPPLADFPATVERWREFEPWDEVSPLWRRWQRIYALRVEIKITPERIVVWPDLSCAGDPEVHGTPLPGAAPEPQSPPKGGTGPRLRVRRAARLAGRLPDVLLGWIGADGFPVAAPVRIEGVEDRGLRLAASPGLLPTGARRAGLTAHSFTYGVLGQNQRKHTGWLESRGGGEAIYAPHTISAYRLPPWRPLYRVVTGAGTRLGVRRARRAGFMD